MNIFDTLGLENSKELELKAQLGITLCKAIAGLNLSQADVAARLGISQPKVSALLNMRLNGFSAERLALLLVRLGHNVELRVSAAAANESPSVGVVEVVLAHQREVMQGIERLVVSFYPATLSTPKVIDVPRKLSIDRTSQADTRSSLHVLN